jgi:hypothetical protein
LTRLIIGFNICYGFSQEESENDLDEMADFNDEVRQGRDRRESSMSAFSMVSSSQRSSGEERSDRSDQWFERDSSD